MMAAIDRPASRRVTPRLDLCHVSHESFDGPFLRLNATLNELILRSNDFQSFFVRWLLGILPMIKLETGFATSGSFIGWEQWVTPSALASIHGLFYLSRAFPQSSHIGDRTLVICDYLMVSPFVLLITYRKTLIIQRILCYVTGPNIMHLN